MEKQIDAVEVRRQFGQLLNDVAEKRDRYVVNEDDEPVAAIIPMALYEQWKATRESFFAQMHATAERANLTEKEGEQLTTEAIAAVRTSDAGEGSHT